MDDSPFSRTLKSAFVASAANQLGTIERLDQARLLWTAPLAESGLANSLLEFQAREPDQGSLLRSFELWAELSGRKQNPPDRKWIVDGAIIGLRWADEFVSPNMEQHARAQDQHDDWETVMDTNRHSHGTSGESTVVVSRLLPLPLAAIKLIGRCAECTRLKPGMRSNRRR